MTTPNQMGTDLQPGTHDERTGLHFRVWTDPGDGTETIVDVDSRGRVTLSGDLNSRRYMRRRVDAGFETHPGDIILRPVSVITARDQAVAAAAAIGIAEQVGDVVVYAGTSTAEWLDDTLGGSPARPSKPLGDAS